MALEPCMWQLTSRLKQSALVCLQQHLRYFCSNSIQCSMQSNRFHTFGTKDNRATEIISFPSHTIYCRVNLHQIFLQFLKDRREIARFFKRQALASNALLHYLLPNDVTARLSAAWEIPNLFPYLELAQISSTNLSCPTVWNTSHSRSQIS